MPPSLTVEQISALEAKGAISPQTAEILRSETQSPGSMTAAPKTLQLPTPSTPPSSGPGEINQEFIKNATVTGPSSVSPEALAASTPAPFPSAQASTVSAPSASSVEDGFNTQRAGVAEAMLARSQAETGMVGEIIKQSNMMEDARLTEERFQTEKNKRLDEAQSLYNQALDALNSQQIDPSRFYARMSTVDKIVAGIGIALGGIAAGMAGKENSAMRVIQDAIDNDIKAQQVEIDKKARSLSAQGNMYSELVGRLQNEDAARHYMTSLMLEQSKSKISQYEAQLQGADKKAQLARLYGEIDVAAAEAQAKAREALEKDPNVNMAIRKGVNEGKIDPALLSKEDRERHIEGVGFAKDKQAADNITKAQTSYNDAVRLIDEMIAGRTGIDSSGKEIRGASGAEFMNRGFIKEQKGRAAQLILKLKDVFSLGVLNSSDYEILNDLVPRDPTELTASKIPIAGRLFGEDPIVAQLKRLKSEFTAQYQNGLRSVTEPSPDVNKLTTPLALTPR